MNRYTAILTTIIVLLSFAIAAEGLAAYRTNPSPPRKITIQQQDKSILLKWKKPFPLMTNLSS